MHMLNTILEYGGSTGCAIPLLFLFNYNMALLGVIFPHLCSALTNEEVTYNENNKSFGIDGLFIDDTL